MSMGIYDDGFDFDLRYGKIKKPLFFIGLAAVLVVVLFVLISSVDMIKPKAVEMKFSDATISSSDQTTLFITITNLENVDASDVLLTVEAADKESIAVSPAKEEIDILEKNGKRIYEFVVNPVGSIPQGTYIVRATLKIKEKVYDSEIALRIN